MHWSLLEHYSNSIYQNVFFYRIFWLNDSLATLHSDVRSQLNRWYYFYSWIEIDKNLPINGVINSTLNAFKPLSVMELPSENVSIAFVIVSDVIRFNRLNEFVSDNKRSLFIQDWFGVWWCWCVVFVVAWVISSKCCALKGWLFVGACGPGVWVECCNWSRHFERDCLFFFR